MIYTLEQIDPTLVQEKQRLEELFSTKIDSIPVDIISREEFSKLGKQKWTTALASTEKNKIIIINQPESCKSPKAWRKTIIHEMVHFFWNKTTQLRYPSWLSEGIATFFSGQKPKNESIRNITLKDLIDHSRKCDKETYLVGYIAVKKLLGEEAD